MKVDGERHDGGAKVEVVGERKDSDVQVTSYKNIKITRRYVFKRDFKLDILSLLLNFNHYFPYCHINNITPFFLCLSLHIIKIYVTS